MPIPIAPVAPFDTVNAVLNTARVRINDAIATLGGELLQNTQPFTQTMAIDGWRNLQAYLANLGFAAFKNEVIITALPTVVGTDPSIQTSLSWTQFFDGQNFWTTFVLPQDLILPLKIWERGTAMNSQFMPMCMALDGLPDGYKRALNYWWEWRENTIYMPGATSACDLRIRYAAYLPDFTTAGPVNWYDQPVPIMRCKSALANYICAEYAVGRGDMDAESFTMKAEKDAKKIFNLEVAAKQRTTVSRRGYSSGLRRGDGGDNRYGY